MVLTTGQFICSLAIVAPLLHDVEPVTAVRDIRAVTQGATMSGVACDHIGPLLIEGANKTNRPMVDLEFQDRSLTLGGWTDPSGHWQGAGGVLRIKNVAFMRGSAPAESPTRAWGQSSMFGGDYLQGVQMYCKKIPPNVEPSSLNIPSWGTCSCNTSDPAKYDQVSSRCKAPTAQKVSLYHAALQSPP